MKVLVFGYSENSERYSYMAFNLLKEYGHQVQAFNPRVDDPKLLDKNFDTLTLYVSSAVSDKFIDLILSLAFKRIIINPGTENNKLAEKLNAFGVEVVNGCTLVMLKTGQF